MNLAISRRFSKLCVAVKHLLILGVVVTSITGTNAQDATYEEGFQRLFDGKTLAGWEGDDQWFRIEGDAIVAGSLEKKIPHNYFLCTEKAYGDFELRLEIRLIGEGENAGVQFRSQRVPQSTEVRGYQADAGIAWNAPVWGGIYDESRRKKMLVMPDAEKIGAVIRKDDWNEMRVLAQGPKIQVFINDVLASDYTEADDKIDRSGIIGLQIHSGPPTEASYRNIRIKDLTQAKP
jgi:Domain of Unknown Function (DUF1080)